MHLADELLEHLLGPCEIGDDAIFHRTDDGDRTGRLTQHLLGALANRLDHPFGIGAAIHTNGNHRGFVENDALAAHINQGIGGTKVDGKIVRKITAQKTEHA